MPCHNCGVLLPIQSIEVDHQNPQVGGRFVLKIFRILGLTTAAGSLLLSAFVFADAMGDLDRFCMNSVLNLVLRCRACNGAKGNLQRAVA